MSTDKNLYVITWSYSDNSAFGVVGVYSDPSLVNDILEVLRQHAMGKQFNTVTCKENKPCQ